MGSSCILGKTRRKIERPIKKLYPVEFQDETHTENVAVNENSTRPSYTAMLAGRKRKFCN